MSIIWFLWTLRFMHGYVTFYNVGYGDYLKRIVGNKNITCLTILGLAFRDSTVIRDKLMILKNIEYLHLTWLNLDESVRIPIP